MTDIRIVSTLTLSAVTMDWLLTSFGTLDETEELATLVKVALGTDGLATADDQLPGLEDDIDRRGWWGDQDAQLLFDGWPIGCRNWLLARSSITDAMSRLGATLARAETYTYEALVPLIQKGIASHVEVTATRPADAKNRIDVQATIYRGPSTAVQLQFQVLWAGVQS